MDSHLELALLEDTASGDIAQIFVCNTHYEVSESVLGRTCSAIESLPLAA